MSEHIIYDDGAIIALLIAQGATEKDAKRQVANMKAKSRTIKTGGGGRTSDTETGRLCALYTANVKTGTDKDGKDIFSRKLDVLNAEVKSYSKKLGNAVVLKLGKLLSGAFSGQARAYGTVYADKSNKGKDAMITKEGIAIAKAESKKWLAIAAEFEVAEKEAGIVHTAEIQATK